MGCHRGGWVCLKCQEKYHDEHADEQCIANLRRQRDDAEARVAELEACELDRRKSLELHGQGYQSATSAVSNLKARVRELEALVAVLEARLGEGE